MEKLNFDDDENVLTTSISSNESTTTTTTTTTTDEILPDGTTRRTLETAAATIRFCFIDDTSTESEDESSALNSVLSKSESEVESNNVDNINDTKAKMSKSMSQVSSIDRPNMISSTETEPFIDESFSDNPTRIERIRSIIDEEQIDLAMNGSSPLDAITPTSEYFSGGELNYDINHPQTDRDNTPIHSGARQKTSVSSETSSNKSAQSFPTSRPSSAADRFNPFDREITLEEDHFGIDRTPTRTTEPSHKLVTNRPQSTSSSNSDDLLISVDEDEFVFAHLGLEEDYFSQPEGHFGLTSREELEMAIEHCKDLINTATSENKKQNLVKKLVQLRLKLQEAKEGPQEVAPDMKVILGHHFKRQESRSAKHYCEKCVGVIWGMLQIWYRCADCGYSCHSKCLGSMTRMCASTKVQESAQYILAICPEKGMAAQQYRCSECRTLISFQPSFEEPRQCDYNGCYYCSLCHWNDTYTIPARVLHNWDFTPDKVCRATKQFLKLMLNKPALCIQTINPMLFSFVEELNQIKRLRQEILMMKQYFLSCQEALNCKLLLQLKERQHFVDSSDMYCMQDLIDLENDTLLPYLCKVHTLFAQHIKTDCHLCQAKGHICELCNTSESLFPFDNHVMVCTECQAVLHRHCYRKKDEQCPKCTRLKVKAAKTETEFLTMKS